MSVWSWVEFGSFLQWLVCHVSVALKAEVKLLSSFLMNILTILFWLFYIFVFICAAAFWYCQSYFGVMVWCRIWLYFQHSGDASTIHLQGKVTTPIAFSNVCHFCLLFLIVNWTINKDLAVQSNDQNFALFCGVGTPVTPGKCADSAFK